MSNEKPLYAFLGHHKCATTWVSDILRQVCKELKLNYLAVPNARAFNYDLVGFIEREGVDFLGYVNADRRYLQDIPHLLALHVVRDPRDICVSAYYSHLHSHPIGPWWPELAGIRERLQGMSKDEGLYFEIDVLAWVYQQMVGWDDATEGILQVRMEDLTRDPYRYFLKIMSFLHLLDDSRYSLRRRIAQVWYRSLRTAEHLSGGRISIPMAPGRIPVERMLGIVWENRFEAKTAGRQQGKQDRKSHYRKGVAGEWREHFGPEHVRHFKEKYNHILLQLGYEQDPDWS